MYTLIANRRDSISIHYRLALGIWSYCLFLYIFFIMTKQESLHYMWRAVKMHHEILDLKKYNLDKIKQIRWKAVWSDKYQEWIVRFHDVKVEYVLGAWVISRTWLPNNVESETLEWCISKAKKEYAKLVELLW